MSRYYIVGWPHSSKLIEQSWYYECFPFEEDQAFLVPENRIVELFGKHHNFDIYSERDELLNDNTHYSSGQYEIDFEDE